MYPVLHALFSDRKGGQVFTCFGFGHLFFIFLALGTAVLAALKLRRTDTQGRERALDRWIGAAFGLYILDFFFMPLAYNEIDIEKLPFHVCTAMCVMCFLSERGSFLKKYHSSFVLLGFISNLVYLIYPAGVMWHGVHPLSYRVVQTLLFHCLMTVYGLLALLYAPEEDSAGLRRRDLIVVVGMTLWALLGNYMYNGTSEGYSHFFNWFFVVRDPFYLLPKAIAPFVMPLLNVALFFGAEVGLRWGLRRAKK